MRTFCLGLAGMLACLASAIPQLEATPLFMTHHAPVGIWSSMTFGLPGKGVGIETEALAVESTGDLIVACSRGAGKTSLLPFLAGDGGEDYEGRMAGNTMPAAFKTWKPIPAAGITRTLTPSVDEFRGGDIRLTVTSPRFPMRTPPESGAEAPELLPALLVEVEIDNSASDREATGFLGIAYKGKGRIRPLDWADSRLAGIGFQDRWALAAKSSRDVFTIRAGSVAPYVDSGTAVIHPGGSEGGIGFLIPPHQKRTLTATLGFYHAGNEVAQASGMKASYACTSLYRSVEAVCMTALDHATAIREAGRNFDAELTPTGSDPLVAEMMAQASQAYYANSSLLRTGEGGLLWSINEGQFGWRNTLDLAVDHLPYELDFHPWLARNVIESFIDRYSYRDQVCFDGESKALHPGGISFAHDQGNYTAYAPPGRGGYEQSDRKGVYSFMTTEQLLNGAYCAAACAIKGGDAAWSSRRLPVALEILTSMEHREGSDPARRGLLDAQSDKVGSGSEITTYDALDESLKDSRGSLYIAVKTWAAALMLERWFTAEVARKPASRARGLADRAAVALEKAYVADRAAFPANVIDTATGGDALVVAPLDPLAVPIYCGLGPEMKRYPSLLAKLAEHGRTCMKAGKCVDATTGGVRLSSSTSKTWPSKVALTLYALSWLENKPVAELIPSAIPEMGRWFQVSSANATISDQIDSSTRQQLSGAYYPRLVTVRTLLQPLHPSVSSKASSK